MNYYWQNKYWIFAHAILILLVVVYSIGRANPYPTYSTGIGDDRILREILAELKIITSELRSIKQKTEVPPSSVKSLFTSRCVSCHGQEVAKEKGFDFVLVLKDGSIPELSQRDWDRILREVNSDRMPKNSPPLSDAEKRFLSEQHPKKGG